MRGFGVKTDQIPGRDASADRRQLDAGAEAIRLWLEVAKEDACKEAGREAGTLAEVTV